MDKDKPEVADWTNKAKPKHTCDCYAFPIDFEFFIYILLHQTQKMVLLMQRNRLIQKIKLDLA